MPRLIYRSIDCPNCGTQIEDVEIEVLAAAEDETNAGAEWAQPQDAVCPGCGDTLTDDDLNRLAGDEIQEQIAQSVDDEERYDI